MVLMNLRFAFMIPPGNFCTGKANGNYPDPLNIYGYITCTNGAYCRVQCPGNLKWNAVKKMCDWQQVGKFYSIAYKNIFSICLRSILTILNNASS